MNVSDELLDRVVRDLADDRRVRVPLPFGGRLHMDCRLPFLCVYRTPADQEDAGTVDLILGQPAYLVEGRGGPEHDRVSRLIESIASVCAELFGSFLLVEVWTAPPSAGLGQSKGGNPPGFDLYALGRQEDEMEPVVSALLASLHKISLRKRHASAEAHFVAKLSPPGRGGLLPRRKARPARVYRLGIAVQPAYRDIESGEVFPLDLRSFRRRFTRALRRGLFEFSLRLTSHAPKHYHVLGRSAFTQAAWGVDRELADIASTFDFLLLVTPVNTESAWHRFRMSSFGRAPLLRLRPLTIDPAHLKRRLYSIDIDRVEDPTLEMLYHEKRLELDRQLTMLLERGTRSFRLGSSQVYGPIDGETDAIAEHLLGRLGGASSGETLSGGVGAAVFAARAQDMLERMRARFPTVQSTVSVVDDITGVMVTGGSLVIGRTFRTQRNRVDALLQHEIGTHIVTYWNGCSQPLGLLRVGLPGYDEMQEGLAILRELAVGGLDDRRLMTLAARVVAARSVERGASFVDTFRLLHDGHGLSPKTAFNAAVRVHRSGGFTKDVVYLRGFVDVARRARSEDGIRTLFTGKLATRHIPIVRELLLRGVLTPPLIDPSGDLAAVLPGRLKKLVRRHGLQRWIE